LVVATLTQWAVARPSRCLIFALLFTLLGTAYSAWQLKFKTSRLDLLDTSAEYNQRWLRYLELFGRRDDAIIVLESPDTTAVAAALKDIGTTLEKDTTFSGVLYSSATPQLSRKRLHFAPPDALTSAQQFLQLSLAINSASSSVSRLPTDSQTSLPRSVTEPVFRTTAAPLSQQWLTLAQMQVSPLLAADAQALLDFLNNPKEQPNPGLLTPLVELVADRTPTIDNSLLLDDNGRLGLCLIPLLHPDDNPQVSSQEINRLREHINELKKRHPGVTVRLTGMPILEADEAQSTQADMMVASVVSMLGVAVLLVVAYGN
jgi:predicted RND superfamily exporter protein